MINNYIPPTESERQLASAAVEKLKAPANGSETLKYYVHDSASEEAIELPDAAVGILSDILEFMAQGHGLALFPRLPEVTTVEAAHILNVSRPYVIKLLDEGALPHRLVGTHRRIPLANLIRYHQEVKRDQEAFLDRLVAESQAMGLYD